ncbi:hypothetical protein [Streptomyces sp. NPDC056543]|uniref:hypothetical protein n=1 Tax=unclassified Streptomyces TaxID=2593676 RepID=UPI00368231FA
MPTPADAEARTTETTWSVVFRTDGSDNWHQWSAGWTDTADALRNAEALVASGATTHVRLERVTTTRERFNLHQLAQLDETAP